MSVLIFQAMSSAECSMGLQSFMGHDEPLSAGRLKMRSNRMCEELEIKTLMKSSNEFDPPKHKNSSDYGTREGSSSASSSSVCSTNSVRPHRRGSSDCQPGQGGPVRTLPSRTPSTASTSLSSNGTSRLKRVQEQGRPEYTEPTILISAQSNHHNFERQPLTNGELTENDELRERCDSRESAQAADAEVCATLRTHGMADEDVLLDEDCGVNEDFGHNEGSANGHAGQRGQLLAQTPSPQSIRGVKMGAPNKSQVLNYIATTKLLCIKRAGTELQVTDTSGFPLLDIWQKSTCLSTTWVLESYGRTILLLSDSSRFWRPWSFGQMKANTLEVMDEDDELLGYFQVGEPFVVQNRDRTPIARFMGYESGDGRSVLFQCVLECSGEEVGRLEPRKAQLSQLRFGQQAMGFPLKLLVLAAAIRIAAMPQVTGFVPNESRSKRRNKKKTFCSIV